MNLTSNASYAPFIKGEHTKAPSIVVLVKENSNSKHAVFMAMAKGKVDLQTLKAAEFKKSYMGTSYGDDYRPNRIVEAWLAAPKMKFSDDAIAHIERILNMDTRGKTAAQIREEAARIAARLPEGNALRAVPPSYPDRAAAIAAYTAIRQELFKLKIEESPMAKKDSKTAAPATDPKAKPAAAAPATEPKANGTKATKDAKATAKAAEKKAAKPKADFSGKYTVAGDAVKAKDTEELGMHGESVRTKILGHVMKSKGKDGVDYASLEKVAGDKTRGALAYLVKRGFLSRVAAK